MISFSSQDAGHVVPRNLTDIRPPVGKGNGDGNGSGYG